jgi:hypothetical protein
VVNIFAVCCAVLRKTALELTIAVGIFCAMGKSARRPSYPPPKWQEPEPTSHLRVLLQFLERQP